MVFVEFIYVLLSLAECLEDSQTGESAWSFQKLYINCRAFI